MEIANPDGAPSGLLQSRVNDHLPVRIREGRKDWDGLRQIWRDPPYHETSPVFAGLGRNWQPEPTGFEVPLLDATYWLDTAMPRAVMVAGAVWMGIKTLSAAATHAYAACAATSPRF
ncbi:MAG: hypothetical protein AAYR33_08155 [Acetobacteraceae bacterium]